MNLKQPGLKSTAPSFQRWKYALLLLLLLFSKMEDEWI